MKFVIFGLGISSAWGNGHATLMRGLLRALIHNGHTVAFFERDVPYYAAHRDLAELPGGELILYADWSSALPVARRQLAGADVGMVTSYCADALAASDLILTSALALRTFYDLDAPVTLERLARGQPVSYIGPRGLRDFDLVLSYAGGDTLAELKRVLGARQVAPLYGSVDPSVHYPVAATEKFRCDLSYLGTYSEDRQQKVDCLFSHPARQVPDWRFVLGGPKYDATFKWSPNIYYFPHVGPRDHPAFYCSSRLTLNVTRESMAAMGYCPSARLFEAAACGVPVLTDWWTGLDKFFEPEHQILIAGATADVLRALTRPAGELTRMALSARERTLSENSAAKRALELERILDQSARSRHTPAASMDS